MAGRGGSALLQRHRRARCALRRSGDEKMLDGFRCGEQRRESARPLETASVASSSSTEPGTRLSNRVEIGTWQ
ncbi:unnamed protein product [Urochloa humidicola]